MKSKKKGLVVMLLILPLLAFLSEKNSHIITENQILLQEAGDREQEIRVTLNAENILQDYDYTITVPERILDQDAVQQYFDQAEQEIQGSFFRQGEDADHVTERVYPRDSYVNGLVSASWTYDSYEFLRTDGMIQETGLKEEGAVVYVEAELKLQQAVRLYGFYLHLYPKALNREEKFLAAVEEEIQKQAEVPGQTAITLPQEVQGSKREWKEESQDLVLKVLVCEIIFVCTLPLAEAEKHKKARKQRDEELLLMYPDLVSKLTVLLGCGMSLQQAWHRISALNSDSRKVINRQNILENEMKITARALEEGESEQIAYQKFAYRIGLRPYYRLVRILLQNLRKGSGGLLEQLQRES